MTEMRTKLMSELEKEKEKLERDIQQLTTNKVSICTSSSLSPHMVLRVSVS